MKYRLRTMRVSGVLPALICLIGIIGVVLPYIGAGALPGDIGDARFNQYILEHFFLAISGNKRSFLNAPFFYPWVRTISFSETHWGTGLVYVCFRITGLTPEGAYAGWFLTGFVLNYWSAYYVNRKFGLQKLGAAIGAFLFAFSLPVIAQDSHAQLNFRIYVPWSLLATYYYIKFKDPRYAAAVMLLLSLQLLTSVYAGLFLLYFLCAFLIAVTLTTSVGSDNYQIINRVKDFLPARGLNTSVWVTASLILIAAIALLLLFAIPYIQVQRLYGVVRAWDELKPMLPQIQSYFLGDRSNFWFSNVAVFSKIPIRHEHQMFIGTGAAFALLILLASKNLLKKNILAVEFIYALVFLFVITLLIGHVSFYRVLVIFPGISSVRAVTREILVLLFPIGYLVGYVIETIRDKDLNPISSTAAAFIMCTIIISDSILADKAVTSANEWRERLAHLNAKIIESVDKSSILVVASQEPSYATELDSMLLAQKLGIRTLNGYSSFLPPGWSLMRTCNDVEHVISSAQNFMESIGAKRFNIDRSKLIFVGFETDCHRVLGESK